MKLPDKVYLCLKWIVIVLLPALSALYYGIAQVWALDIYAEQVVGTIAVVETFLGTIIGISTYNYNKAQENIEYDMLERTIGKEIEEENKGE